MSEPRRARIPTSEAEMSDTPSPEDMTDTVSPEVSEEDTVTPTLRDAFYLLCDALAPYLEDDMPRWTHSQEIQGWMTDSGDDVAGLAQQALAWTHAIALLESVLGRPLLQR